MDINAHSVRKVTAVPHHSGETHWIDLVISERSNYGQASETNICLFTEGEDAKLLVDLYAAAINGVNRELEISGDEEVAA